MSVTRKQSSLEQPLVGTGHRAPALRDLCAILLLQLVLACSSASPESRARDAELRGVVSAALGYAVQTGKAGSRQCVMRRVSRSTFERWRAYEKAGGELTLGLADPKDYRWNWSASHQPAAVASLQTALRAAIAQDGDRRLRSLPQAWIDPNLQVVRAAKPLKACPIHILSEPAVVNGWAFIEDDIVCGPQCGAGKTLALRRSGDRWLVVAVAPTWHVGFERMLREPLPPPDSDQIVDL